MLNLSLLKFNYVSLFVQHVLYVVYVSVHKNHKALTKIVYIFTYASFTHIIHIVKFFFLQKNKQQQKKPQNLVAVQNRKYSKM